MSNTRQLAHFGHDEAPRTLCWTTIQARAGALRLPVLRPEYAALMRVRRPAGILASTGRATGPIAIGDEQMPSHTKGALPRTRLRSFFRLPERFFVLARKRGLRVAVQRALMRIFGLKGEIARAKDKVLGHLWRLHGGVVAYGPFKGMRLSQEVWWGHYDLITKTLGVYEHHVLEKLFELRGATHVPFVDIGAADGYFAIGAAVSGLSQTVYAYEITTRGREALAYNAQINGCLEKITICAEANFDSLSQLILEHGQALMLIDIEGFEFDLLDERVLNLLSDCHIIVELHPSVVEHGHERQERLINAARRHFDAHLIERECYRPNGFPELSEFSDDERLLALSEGRGRNMQWLVLSPR